MVGMTALPPPTCRSYYSILYMTCGILSSQFLSNVHSSLHFLNEARVKSCTPVGFLVQLSLAEYALLMVSSLGRRIAPATAD